MVDAPFLRTCLPHLWGRGTTLVVEGDAPFGPKVLKVLKFDTAFGREGCGGRLGRQYKIRLRRHPPFGACRHHLSPGRAGGTMGAQRWCHMTLLVSVERFILSPEWGKVRRSRIRGSHVSG